MLDFTFLTEEQCFGDKQLDILKKYGTKCAITDFSILFWILYFDMQLIKIALKKEGKDKFTIVGILSMLLFQQIQNIGMNIGLLPITGITLPFISYGGSSLVSYMMMIGIILNINKN